MAIKQHELLNSAQVFLDAANERVLACLAALAANDRGNAVGAGMDGYAFAITSKALFEAADALTKERKNVLLHIITTMIGALTELVEPPATPYQPRSSYIDPTPMPDEPGEPGTPDSSQPAQRRRRQR